MNTIFKKLSFLSALFFIISCNAPGGNENTIVSIKTSLGDIKIKLYDGTPIHRDNFIKLINTGFYDGISFHRVIKNFMIQAGDPATKIRSLLRIFLILLKHIQFLLNSIISIFIKKERLLLPVRVMM